MTEETPNAPTSTASAVSAPITASSGAPIAATDTIPNAPTVNAPVIAPTSTAPATPTNPPLTKEQHETLLQRIAEMPLEIGAWLKKELKLAEHDIEKI